MPRRKKVSDVSPRQTTRRSTRGTSRKETIAIPDVYRDMLAEAAAAPFDSDFAARPRKRRRLSEESVRDEREDDLFGEAAESATTPVDDPTDLRDDLNGSRNQQIVYDDFEGSEGSDVEFEDVELDPHAEDTDLEEQPDQKLLRLDLSKPDPTTPKRAIQRRKPLSRAERDSRLDVHKWHILCLLLHLQCRNHWCNSEQVQASLKPLVPRKTISLLHIDEDQAQYQRSYSFNKGIEEVCAIWKHEWTITAQGLRRAQWKEGIDAAKESEEAEDPVDFDDFKTAALTRAGSRDLGAQLLCALLRSVAVDTRLVFSLQPLPFSGVTKGQTPEKAKPAYVYAPAQNYNASPQRTTITRPTTAPTQVRKKIIDSPFPIFWVEVYSPAAATWIPLDPLVRNTINKPKTGFEPPSSDNLNSMTYVIAFDDDGIAKDVTRRYTQWYNAKTRKLRVESTKGGAEWWATVMDVLSQQLPDVRDEIEDAELLRRAGSEGMPRNVQDFRGHPIYVLERHLRANEVIHPRREVGKLSAGLSKSAKLESVFRRQDVHLCRSADAWYRRGRDVDEGEQPLKRVVPKRGRDGRARSAEDEDGEEENIALYAEYQTSVYEPPPVVGGRIPKNGFGNLDVYVPSMIPPGAVHVRHPLAAKAAKILAADYADAVTGFDFKGRQGTAIVVGVVVATEITAAVVSVIEGLEWQGSQEVEAERSRIVLGTWKRLMMALRVRERIERDYGDREEDEDEMREAGGSAYSDSMSDGGGFMPEAIEPDSAHHSIPGGLAATGSARLPSLLPDRIVHQEIVVVRSPHKLVKPSLPTVTVQETDEQDGVNGGGFLVDEAEEGGGFIPEAGDDAEGGGSLPADEDEASSRENFYPKQEDEDVGQGGFIADGDGSAPDTLQTSIRQADAALQSDETFDDMQERLLAEAEGPDRAPQQSMTIEATDPATASASRLDIVSKRIEQDDRSESSLLSHDPEEEDAEPEWLVNSLED